MHLSIASPLVQPSPNGRRVGIRIVTFEACSGFTHVTARRIAQPPKATFVTRLQPFRLPSRAARQLPDQSTTLRVESSSTDGSRHRGARPKGDIATRSPTAGVAFSDIVCCTYRQVAQVVRELLTKRKRAELFASEIGSTLAAGRHGSGTRISNPRWWSFSMRATGRLCCRCKDLCGGRHCTFLGFRRQPLDRDSPNDRFRNVMDMVPAGTTAGHTYTRRCCETPPVCSRVPCVAR